MKGKKLTEWFANKKVVSSCAAIVLAAVIGGVSLFSGSGDVPEFPSYTDPIMEASIPEEETPLASQPKTTVKTTSKTKTTKKTVKLKKAAKKSKRPRLPILLRNPAIQLLTPRRLLLPILLRNTLRSPRRNWLLPRLQLQFRLQLHSRFQLPV